MNRSTVILLGAATLAACSDLGGSHRIPIVLVSPVLDSVFVGDRLPPHQVTYIDDKGNAVPPGNVLWGTTDTSIIQVDAGTGAVTGRKRGAAVITASAQGVTGGAWVVVSDTLDITLLLDTVYVMPGDTLSVPVIVLKRTVPPPAVVWFAAPTNPTYTIDSASGRIAAVAPGGPWPYVVHADALVDTGAVYVLSLADTAGGGKMFFSVRGTAITHVGGPARALNFTSSSGKLAFQLRGTYVPSGAVNQLVQIIRPDSVSAPGVYPIDSLNPDEDAALLIPPAVCAAPRSWALWKAVTAGIGGYSRRGGTLGVTQIVTIPNGQAMSGRFSFTAQRTDLYTNPLGALSVTGSFVAPLVPSTTVCR